MAVDVSVTVVVLYVPDAVAVFGCEPDTAVIGPTTQVAIWLSLASATGSANGEVRIVPSPSVQVQPARLTVGSETLTELNATSPTFSTVIR